MAAEEAASEVTEKPRSILVPVLIGVFVSVLLSVGAVVGTLYFTGYFSDQTPLEAELAKIEEEAAAAAAEATPVGPQLMETPNPSRLDTLYYEMTRPLTANVSNSKKIMQLTVAVMTHYDQMVIDRVIKHELQIRSAMLSVLSAVTEDQTVTPTFKEDLAESLKLAANEVLEEQEDFGGIEKVLFIEYLMQ
jgi:flagellar FliL protein